MHARKVPQVEYDEWNYRRAASFAKVRASVSFSIEDKKRMAWHSRRGMLELDLILVPFVERHLSTLSETELQLYQGLLQEEDQDLFVWLTKREPAPTPELRQIVGLVLDSRQVP